MVFTLFMFFVCSILSSLAVGIYWTVMRYEVSAELHMKAQKALFIASLTWTVFIVLFTTSLILYATGGVV